MLFKYGKKPARRDHRTLRFAEYLNALPPVPMPINWSDKVATWTMMANDTVGDCTIAGPGHLEVTWGANAQGAGYNVPTDQQILAAYTAITGYNPNDPSTDTGANILDVLNYWKSTGIAGQTIGAYMAVNPQNVLHVQQGIWLFGGLDLGFSLPDAVEPTEQGVPNWILPDGQTPTGAWAPDQNNGHCVCAIDCDTTGVTVVTWGQLMRLNWPFFLAYCDEAYALVANEWIANTGLAPSGFNMNALVADLNAIR